MAAVLDVNLMTIDDARSVPAVRRKTDRQCMSIEADNPLDAMRDEGLVEAYRAGRTDALEVLIERYRTDLYYFLSRFTGNRHAAEDVFQEAFLQVYNSLDSFDTSRRFKPWLFTIAANKARDLLRKKTRRREAPLSAPISRGGGSSDGPTFVDLMEADIPLPDDAAKLAELQGLVREVVASMPDHLREVLVLAYFQKLAYKEVAEVLSVPLGTVKSRLHASVATFAKLWKAKYEDYDGLE